MLILSANPRRNAGPPFFCWAKHDVFKRSFLPDLDFEATAILWLERQDAEVRVFLRPKDPPLAFDFTFPVQRRTSLVSISKSFTRIWAVMSLCSVVLKRSCNERFFDS